MGKIGGVIVSHGQLANELLSAAETVIGPAENIYAVSIGWHDDVEIAKSEIERAIAQADQGSGVIVMTDMFGGTPTNISAMFLKKNEVEIVTGVNLPMIIRFITSEGASSLETFASEIEEQGKQAIYRTSALLEPQKMKKDA